ncbi:MAG TPA: cyclic nucleotide-binding domain-containing protein [Gammaproteobacteria bacterium]
MDLASKTYIEELPKGKSLFKKGDNDNFSYYIIQGDVALISGSEPDKLLSGGTAQSRFPLDHHRPRQASAITQTDIRYIRIDNDLLDILLTWDQNATYRVDELENSDDDDNDWMSQMLRSEIFHRIPAGNIQAVFMRMEAISVKAGENVITQGEDGDYYYFIRKGRCVVNHTATSGKVIKLAELDAGQGFGEEALISGAKRNATITMLTDGSLMRLAKQHFDELLKAPVLRSFTFDQAKQKVHEGAVWLDVRLESEHKNVAIPGSVNIPLYLLRHKAATLDKSKQYVVYCDTGRRSSSAAYLLSERGINAAVLSGGLMSLKQGQAAAG